MTYEKPLNAPSPDTRTQPAGRSGAPTSDEIKETEKWLRTVESKAASSRDPMLEIPARAGKQTLEAMKAENRKG